MTSIAQRKSITILTRDIAIAIISFALVAIIVRQVLWQGGLADRSLFDAEASRAADYARGIVFLGASHFGVGVDPATFDTTPTGQRLDARAFDLTLGGMSAVEMRRLAERFFDLHPCCVKYVVIEAAFMQTDIGWFPNDLRSVLFFDLANAIDFLRMIFSYSILPTAGQGRWDYVRNVAFATAMHYTNTGLAAVVFGWGTPIGNYRLVLSTSAGEGIGKASTGETRTVFTQGVEAYMKWRPKFLAGDENPYKRGTFVNQEMLDYVLETIRLIERHDVTVIVVQPPLLGNWPYAVDFVEGFRERCGERHLIDFSDPVRFADLFQNLDYWMDGSHLSHAGARVLTTMLAKRIGEIIDDDAARGGAVHPACG
jgi:hypothetical protein